MGTIEVLLTVPDWVQSGLSLGQFERVGGVVREVSTGRVVAWLRDGAVSLPTNSAVPSSMLHMAGSLAGAGFLINLALTASSLSAILVRLNNLQNAVTSLHSEFDRDRVAEFKNALEDARDAVELNNADARFQRANNAISDLRKSSLQLHQSYVEAQNSFKPVDAAGFLIRETYAVSAMVRCYLEMDEAEIARLRLTERVGALLTNTQELASSLLGDHPAAFLYRDVPEATARRFASVQEWLHSKSFAEIVLTDLRHDFWNDGALEAENAFVREVTRRLRRTAASAQNDRLENLALVESLIENVRRIEGFELELRSMRLMGLPFKEWTEITDSGVDFAVIVPPEPLEMRQ